MNIFKSIKPKHESLRELPNNVYKKLPLKVLNKKTLFYLQRNFPEQLLTILNSKHTDYFDKCIVLEVMSRCVESEVIIDSLIAYSKHELPAIREAAVYSLSFFPTFQVIEILDEIEKIEYNEVIRDCAKLYLDEIFI